MSKVSDRIEIVIDKFGYDDAVRELCKQKICISRAEARRHINHVKIIRGDKIVKQHRSTYE